jgi:hypothetical protein
MSTRPAWVPIRLATSGGQDDSGIAQTNRLRLKQPTCLVVEKNWLRQQTMPRTTLSAISLRFTRVTIVTL